MLARLGFSAIQECGVVEFRGGATMMANNSENVNLTVTAGLTGRKTGVTVLCMNSRGRNVGTGRRLSRCNAGIRRCFYSISGFRRSGGVISGIVRSFNDVRVLMGGTNVAESGLILGVSRGSFSTMVGMGLGNAFGVVGRACGRFVGGHCNEVYDATSVINLANGTNRTGCSTSGTNVVNLAGSITGRLTNENIATGTITPNCVTASVADMLPSGMGSTVGTRVPTGHVNAPSSITSMMTFLYSSSTTCMANRIVEISNKLTVWLV